LTIPLAETRVSFGTTHAFFEVICSSSKALLPFALHSAVVKEVERRTLKERMSRTFNPPLSTLLRVPDNWIAGFLAQPMAGPGANRRKSQSPGRDRPGILPVARSPACLRRQPALSLERR